LTSISVGNNNANYSSLNGVLFNKYKTTLIQFPGGKVGSYTTIPDSVTSIGPGAFRHANLTSVIIPNSVTSISTATFYYCSALTSVIIGNSVVSIGNSAFESCVNLTSVVIGNSVVSIGVGAFAECAGLTSITIPDSVTSIGDGAFVNSGLATVIIAGNKVISGITFQSPASGVSFFEKTVTTFLKQFDAPTFSITYSGNTAIIAYVVTSGVTQVELRKVSGNFIITTATVTGTTGTITVTVTENINVFLAAVENSAGGRSAASTAQTLLKQYSPPTLSVGPTYTTLSAGSYRAAMTYTVASGVDAVQVRKASDGSVVSGTTTSVSGTTATITVPFTETLNIVVVALGNAIGRESAQSAMHSLRQMSGSTHYSVVPTAMRQTLAGFPSLGAKKTWTFTIDAQLGFVGLAHNSVTPLFVEFKGDRLMLMKFNGSNWGSAIDIFSGFHDLPRPTTFTVSFDAKSFLISYANGTKTVSYPNYYPALDIIHINLSNITHLNTDPVFSHPTTWEMRIAFRSTGSHNSWRALVGEMRTNIIDRGWGVWINDVNNIHFSWDGPSWDASPALTVAQNTDYVLDIIKTAASLRLVLTNVAANTTQTAINTDTAAYMMSANGPVTAGGWILNGSEIFEGTISFVEVWNSLTSQ